MGLKLGWGGFDFAMLYLGDGARYILITNRKLHMGFRLQQKLITLNDLERQSDQTAEDRITWFLL